MHILITLYNNSTRYMLNYHIYDVIRSYLFFTKINHGFIQKNKNKKKTWLILNHDNHKLTMVLQH